MTAQRGARERSLTHRSRVGADVGGTFTDVVLETPGGGISFTKVLSTPDAYDQAVVEAIQELVAEDAALAITNVIHGTTVATNAVLERRGARTALVTTAGFRDVLEMRRMRMPHLYDLFWNKPPSLVDRHLRFEIQERVMADGTVLSALDEEEVRQLVRRLREVGAEAIAVCFLHAHRYPPHEERFGEILSEEWPEAVFSLSSQVLREEQEYERSATTVVNAYVRPLMSAYIGNLQGRLGKVTPKAMLTIMKSSGGVMPADEATKRPVYALESGPAAGVVGAVGIAAALGQENVIAFDMGGTTAKASLIERGRVARSQEYEVGASLSVGSRLLRGSGELIRVPTIDIAEVGAGGGSIAWLDPAGGFQVGPRSAGAQPGPACYGLDGHQPTVTDANVVLGYIPTGPLASGSLSISAELASDVVGRLADSLGMPTLEAARGIHRVANATMIRALRAVSSEKGHDPRDFTLLAYGGSGPIHAAGLAEELGIRTAIVPPMAGLFSAVGLLYARVDYNDVRYCRLDARSPDFAGLSAFEDDMCQALTVKLSGTAHVHWHRSADLRYRGQSWSIEVDFPGDTDDASVRSLVQGFEQQHQHLYGVAPEAGSPIEIRALRLRVQGPANRGPVDISPHAHPRGSAQPGVRLADFGKRHGPISTPVLSRESLGRETVQGPVLIDEYDTTVVVPPGWTVRRHESGAVVLEHSPATRPRADRRRSTELNDAVTRQLLASNLAATADEMATTIFRTAHSAVVRDAMDFSAALCGPNGDTVAQAVTIPLQLGSIPTAMHTLFEHYGGQFRPGDVYMVNDPFDGASHTPDIFIVKPVFLKTSLLGFAVTVAHHADLGGRVPGTIACDCREVFEEGLRLPWLRLYSRGEPVEDIVKIIRANIRLPYMTLGDIAAQVAACNMGERGLIESARRYGPKRLIGLMTGLVDHTERLLRQEIASWPDGTSTFTDYLDSDGIEMRDVPITVHLTIRGDEIVADFSDSGPMVRGALNCTPSFAEASTYQAVMAACSVDIPGTSGATRPIKVITKPGTVTHVVMPGASSMRGITGYRISDVVNGALAQLIPHRVPACGEGGSTLAFFAGWTGGERFVFSELVVGTWGGRPISDGNDGLANPCASISNIPIEVAESDWPIFIERYGLVTDSGGAGKYRGGLAVERAWRTLVDDTQLQVRSDRQRHRPYGLAGGLSGAASRNLLTRRDGTSADLPTMFGETMQAGDRFHHRMPGGGGWGDPYEREPSAVALDVLNQKVSVKAALDVYGVVVDDQGQVDDASTRATREARRANPHGT
jgi:5-oxoprolinase (ATP-hydrolysing)/N-methylhydantoinase A